MNLIRLASACLFLLLAAPGLGVGSQEGEQPDPLTGLYRFENCIYIEAEWNDGDSFKVRLPTGRQVTARLYQVDTIETSIHDTTAARRLRAQRRYFGISDFGSSPRESIEKAIELGEAATQFTRKALSQPFTLWTSFADARGGGDRIYVFIETADGQSLADQLVKAGLARAFGVYRQTHRGVSQSESIDRMRDLELSAAAGRRGIWAYTDWEALPNERLEERAEIEELRAAMRLGPEVTSENPIAIDQADASALQQLPGVGPALAQRIIEQRERQAFRRKADLLKVPGIGPKTFDTLEPLITLSVEDEED
ncbi:MAG: helix-hairpin-helix domain-containing protein [Opitutales bacterium]